MTKPQSPIFEYLVKKCVDQNLPLLSLLRMV